MQWLFLAHRKSVTLLQLSEQTAVFAVLPCAQGGDKVPTHAAQMCKYGPAAPRMWLLVQMPYGNSVAQQHTVELFYCWEAGLHAAVHLLIKLTEIN